MPRNLSEEDLQAVAASVVDLVIKRLTSQPPPQPKLDVDQIGDASRAIPQIRPKLTYTVKELCAELSLSNDTIYKLVAAGRLTSIPGIRYKIFSRTEVERFLRGDKVDRRR